MYSTSQREEKIYERIVLERLTCHVLANNPVSEEKLGFMPYCPSTQEPLELSGCLSSGLHRKTNNAFNSTYQIELLDKLSQISVRGELIKVIDSNIKRG